MKFICIILFANLSLGVIGQDVFDAARTGNLGRLKDLKEINADTLESVNLYGFTPLIIATYTNHEKCVAYLISQEVDLDFNSPEGPALLGACYKGNISIISLLLESGSEVNVSGVGGTTPLMYAVQKGEIEIVNLLLDAGAVLSLQDNDNLTAVDYAKKLKHDEIVNLLLSYDD